MQYFITEHKHLLVEFNISPLCVFKLASVLATCPNISIDPSRTRRKRWYKKAAKTREQNYSYSFHLMSPVLLFAYGTKKLVP